MLNNSHNPPFREKGLPFPLQSLLPQAMLGAAGRSRITTHDYDWHGLKRRSTPRWILFQYTLEGWGKLRYEKDEYRVGPGQAMLLHFPYDNRYWIPRESSHWEFIYLCLYGDEVVRIGCKIIEKTGPILNLPRDSHLVSCVESTVEGVLDNKIVTPFSISQAAYAVVMKMADEYLVQNDDTGRPAAIQRAIDFCTSHMHEQVTVDQMAREAGYSRFHFARLFKASGGVTPSDYLTETRLRKAVNLLRSTALSVKEITTQCGFYDTTHFCKAFRKKFGMSPGEFRSSGIFGA